MQAYKTELPEVLIIVPSVFEDKRGFFLESYNKKEFDKLLGKEVTFVQDNHSNLKKEL